MYMAGVRVCDEIHSIYILLDARRWTELSRLYECGALDDIRGGEKKKQRE